jgi:hypothetical protein
LREAAIRFAQFQLLTLNSKLSFPPLKSFARRHDFRIDDFDAAVGNRRRASLFLKIFTAARARGATTR